MPLIYDVLQMEYDRWYRVVKSRENPSLKNWYCRRDTDEPEKIIFTHKSFLSKFVAVKWFVSLIPYFAQKYKDVMQWNWRNQIRMGTISVQISPISQE